MPTITEALAEIKTIGKRMPPKQQQIMQNIARQEGLKDPLIKEGGSVAVIAAARQSMTDLETRHVALRLAIQEANRRTDITIDGETHSIAYWLTWRKEVLPGRRTFLTQLGNVIQQNRQAALSKGFSVVRIDQTPAQGSDLMINVDEDGLAKEIEHLAKIEGDLDGQLSLKNATVLVDA
jgi:hypothetical protein